MLACRNAQVADGQRGGQCAAFDRLFMQKREKYQRPLFLKFTAAALLTISET